MIHQTSPQYPLARDTGRDASIRGCYEQYGAEGYYEQHGSTYRNPHEALVAHSLKAMIQEQGLNLSHVLDLAAGSGEATLVLQALGATKVVGIDPYTADAYASRTGSQAQRHTFADIAAGALIGRRYSLIVCSFALHLCDASRLPTLAYQLGQITNCLLVVTPHKRPVIRAEWGWNLVAERLHHRVRSRLYRTAL